MTTTPYPTDNQHDTHLLTDLEDGRGLFDPRPSPNLAFAATLCLCIGFWALVAAVAINW